MKIISMWFHLFTAATLLVSCAAAPIKPEGAALGDYGYAKQYLAWLIQRETKKNNVTGLSIALIDDQRIIWAEGFGYADKSNGISATPETIYRVGSISKLFTATAVMQMAAQGKVAIDDPLQTYLPEFTVNTRFLHAGPITPHNIMTHHSGLPANYYKGLITKNPEPIANLIEKIKGEYVAYPPDFVYSYSNLAFTLLGCAVERISGKDFSAFMDESVLRPLGMFHSSFNPIQDSLLSKGYRGGEETDEPPIRDLPAGGLASSVLDLGRFLQMVFAEGQSGDRRILKPETLAEMLRPQNTAVPLDLNFHTGLGWALSGLGNIDIRQAGPVIHHSGSTLFFHGQLIALPKHKLGVAVLANSSSARGTVDKVATEALKIALEAKTGIKQPLPTKPSESNNDVLSPKELQAYEGFYATIIGAAKITGKEEYLEAEVMNKTFKLVPRSDRLLGLKYKIWGLIPVSLGSLDFMGISRADIAGHDILFARMGSQEILVGEKITPSPVSEKWVRRIGAYKIANTGDDTILFDKISLIYLEGFLCIEHSLPFMKDGTMRYAIAPVSDTEAVILGLGSGMGETLRAITIDGKERLIYSGYLFEARGREM